jgi:hypothetical protein
MLHFTPFENVTLSSYSGICLIVLLNMEKGNFWDVVGSANPSPLAQEFEQ